MRYQINQQNKKAVVVGGSNGIGLALCSEFISRGYYVEIFDIVEPDKDVLNTDSYHYNQCDLLEFNEDVFQEVILDDAVNVLFITAGIGRMADFQYFHHAEIEKTLRIDAESVLKILNIFYSRILSSNTFYTGVMGSIAGWMSTPSGAVYSAAKAALVRFVESVNIELEKNGTENRILDVSPSSFKGSRFYGGKNDISLMYDLSTQIIDHLFDRDTIFIPKYDELLKGVLERYHNDPHEYGLYSYDYKQQSGRVDNNRRVKIGYLSGTFDLFHIGHLNLLRKAKHNCDYLIVGVHNSGKWKGKETFIPLEERKAIVASCRYVDKVIDSLPEDCDVWDLYHYDKLFVGSDYKGTERFNRYEEYFKDKGVEIVYFPYTKGTSSSQIRDKISNSAKEEEHE